MEVKTHKKIDRKLCGKPVELQEGRAKVEMITLPEMAADEYGLVHGGFIFGLADYAAMLAVNHPNVVLGAAEVKFLKPVRVGEKLVAEAEVIGEQGKKRNVKVSVRRDGEEIFVGNFICFVLDRHVLEKP